MDQTSAEKVQCPEDQRAPGYDNIARGWVRGAPDGQLPSMNNEVGTNYPGGGFDKQSKTGKR